jgi:uncharacterized protein (TIGR02231 family)
MKFHLTLTSLLLILCSSVIAFADSQAVSALSRISAVTVYADRAQVTRSCQLSLKAGTNLVSFDALPLTMAEDSIRAEGTGTGRARIAGMTVKTVFLERLQEKRIHDLEQEIQTLNRKIESIEARRKALAAQRAFIDSIRLGWGERISKDLSAGKPSTAELGEAAKFVGDGIGKVEEATYDAEAARKPLQDQMGALQLELEKARGNRNKEVRSVEVAIEADRAMAFTLTLSYLVADAHWEPTYDVRLAPDGASAELSYRAQIWQKSGEDWPGVKLSLSSARPEAGGAPPELFPWQVSLYEPPRPFLMGARAKSAMAPAPAPTMAREAREAQDAGAPPERMEQALPLSAQVDEGQTSVLFQVVQPVDIPADGTRAGSVIAIQKVPVTAEFLTVPKLSSRVYLKSEVTNATDYPLLAGQVNVFNDAVFTGRSYLKTVAAGEKFDLFFGSDDQLKVKREVAKVRKKAGLLGSNSLSYRCTVELENFKKRAVTVTLLDQLPLAGNGEIKVGLDNAQPKPEETRGDGRLLWKVQLAPGEKKKIGYDIVIEYPKGRDLAGTE